ncbi:MAG: gamma carbonic anhydrase family protein [Myxococcota bacterium]|nr:gamma carbonic anhydrase family protein [Myxococcota bacterium]
MSPVHESVFVAPGVQLYGEISVGFGSSIWPNAVIRAETQAVRVGRYTNIQDFVMLHVGYDHATEVGDFCSITHHTTLHGCRIEDHCLIGINSVIMDGAVIGEGSIVAGGAMVTEGKIFPPESIIAGVPAKKIGERDARSENRLNAWQYHRNAQAYQAGEHRGWNGPEYERWLEAKRVEVESGRDLQALEDPPL